jgi:CRISPR system Cascade subunit CasE
MTRTIAVPTTIYRTYFVTDAESDFARFAREKFYQLHRFLYAGFPNKETAVDARVLFRYDEGADGIGCLVVQSLSKPDYSAFARKLQQDGCSIIGPNEVPVACVAPGSTWVFRVLARPTKRLGSGPDKGKRRALRTELEQLAWLHRKASETGFRVERALATTVKWMDDKPLHSHPHPLHAVLFDGYLTVEDPELVRSALVLGIGTQKGYGFGLLSLRSASYER